MEAQKENTKALYNLAKVIDAQVREELKKEIGGDEGIKRIEDAIQYNVAQTHEEKRLAVEGHLGLPKGTYDNYLAYKGSNFAAYTPESDQKFREALEKSLYTTDDRGNKTAKNWEQQASSLKAAAEEMRGVDEATANRIEAFAKEVETRKQVLTIERQITKERRASTRGLENDLLTAKGRLRKGLNDMVENAENRMLTLIETAPQKFADGMTDALMELTDGVKSVEDAFKDVAINFGKQLMRDSINALISKITSKTIEKGVDYVGKLFGQSGGLVSSKGIGYQSGGVILANNGAFVNGSGSGDRYPAMLENGEYVLNRNAVKMMGGKNALDKLNFQNAPRFAVGGGFSMGPNEKNKTLDFGFDSGISSMPMDESLFSARAIQEDEYFKNVKQEAMKKAQEDAIKKYQNKVKNLQLITGIMSAVGGLMVSLGPAIGAAASASSASTAAGNAGAQAVQDGTLAALDDATQVGLEAAAEQGGKTMSKFMKENADKLYTSAGSLADVNASLKLTNLGLDDVKAFSNLTSDQLTELGRFSNNMTGTGELVSALNKSGINFDVPTNFFTKDLSKYKFFSTLDKFSPGSVTGQSLNSAQSILGNYSGRRQIGGYIGYNSGGFVPYGSRLNDTIPALLTGGEYVMNNSAVKKYGLNTMNAMNAGAYQSGGSTENSATTNNSTSNNNTNISINVDRNGKTVYGSDTSSYDKKDVVISRQMAVEINKIVLRSMSNEKRYGGELYKNPLRT
jgi:hypothetical protein